MTCKKNPKNTEMDIFLHRIEYADDMEINQIIAAVNRHFRAKFPDWDVLYISCPKNDPDERKRTLAYINEYFQGDL